MVTSANVDHILSAIQVEIGNSAPKFKSIGVRNGMTGLSLFYLSYARFTGCARYKETGLGYLYNAIELLNAGYVTNTAIREVAEIGHFLEICDENGLFEEEISGLLADFDTIIYKELSKKIGEQNVDPAIGALAFGLYFLKRKNSKVADQAISEIAGLINDTVCKDESGAFWRSKLHNSDAVYLGISHGSAAIINYLTILSEKGYAEEAFHLIPQAAAYIKNNQLTGLPVYFPVIAGKDDHEKPYYANNWCYGDPGTLYGLFQASEFSKDEALRTHCLTLYREVVKRRSTKPFLSTGYSLLYGTAGLAMIYYRLYERTKENFLLDAYTDLMNDLIGRYDPSDQFLGYRGYWNQEFPHINYCLAEGLAGIGLSLMAFADTCYQNLYRTFFFME